MRSLLLVFLLLADASAPVRGGLDPKRCGLLRTVAPRAGALIEVCFSPDGRRAALVGSGPTALLYDAGTWREIRPLQTPVDVSRVAFGPGGKILAAGGRSGKVTLLETETGRVLRTLEGDAPFGFHRMAFAPDGKTLLAGTGNVAAWVWDVESGRRLHSLPGHSAPVSGAAFSPRGHRAATGGGGGVIQVWNTAAWECERTLRHAGGNITVLAFSPAGNRLASGDTDRGLHLWNLDKGELERSFEGHSAAVQGVAFTADGRHLISASADLTVRLWDVASGAEVARLRHHWASVTGLALHPSGTFFATTGADRMLKIWGRVPDVAASLRPRGIAGVFTAPTGRGAGVTLTSVSADGAAGKAGLCQGDVIRSIGGLEVNTFDQTADAIQSHYGGDEVDFVIERGGGAQTVRVTLGAWPTTDDR